MDLYSIFLWYASSSASGQIHLSLRKIPIDNGQPPLPPTAPSRQFSGLPAGPPKRVPSLQHCLLSDGGLDVEKYLHVKLPLANGCSGGLMALNLIHGVGESLSAGSKARSLAMDFKKIPGTKMCLWTQRFCGFGIAGHETQRIPVVGYVCK